MLRKGMEKMIFFLRNGLVIFKRRKIEIFVISPNKNVLEAFRLQIIFGPVGVLTEEE